MALPAPKPNTTVAITGASSGIGAQMAQILAAKGYSLTLIARRTDRLNALADELKAAHGVAVEVISADLADSSARATLSSRLSTGPTLIGLINNAGFGSFGPVSEADQDMERGMIEVNIAAVHDLTLRLLPGMIERGEGAILNTASTAGAQPMPNMSTYAATKAFVTSFSEGLSAELSGSGVSCTALCPGPVRTEFSEVAGSVGLEDSMPGIAVVEASEVARQAIEGMLKGSRMVIPGFANRLTAVAGRMAPRSLVLPIAAKFTSR